MKKYFRLISMVLVVVGLISLCVGCSMWSQAKSVEAANMAEKQAAEERVVKYYDLAETEGLFRMYRSYELTPEILTSRKGTIIVEVVVGRCIDVESGAGVVVGKELEYYNYISYKNVPGVKTNDVLCTYLVYNPDNNYEDDIIERYDFIIETSN